MMGRRQSLIDQDFFARGLDWLICGCERPPGQAADYSLTLSRNAVLAVACFLIGIASISGSLLGQSQDATERPNLDQKQELGEGANSPEEALFECYFSILTGDRQRLRNVADQTSGMEWETLGAVLKFSSEASKFREDFVAVYGLENWNQFNNPNHLPYPRGANAGANGSISIVEVADIVSVARDAKRNRDGNRSSVENPSGGRMLLVEIGDRWYFNVASFAGQQTAEQTRAAVDLLNGLTPSLQVLGRMIGAKGVSPDDIDFEFGRSTLEELQQFKVPAEPRFDFAKTSDANRPAIETRANKYRVLKQRWKAKSFEIVKAALNGDPSQFLESLHPALRIHFPEDKIAAEFQAISSIANAAQWSIDRVEQPTFASDDDSLLIVAKIPLDESIVVFQLFVLDDQLVGLQVESDAYVFDSRNIDLPVAAIDSSVDPFAVALFSGETDKAYSLMPSVYRDEKSIESFKVKFRFPLTANLEQISIVPEQTRILWPPHESQGLQLLDLRFAQSFADQVAKRSVVRSEFSALEDGNLEWKEVSIAGQVMPFFSNRDSNAIAFLKAVGAGDSEKCIELFPPQNQTDVEPIVFDAFVRSLATHLGEFKRIAPTHFKKQTSFEDASFRSVSEGRASFANGNQDWKFQSQFGFLISFDLYDLPEDLNWVAKIGEKSAFWARADEFIREVTTENGKWFDLLEMGLQKELADRREQFSEQLENMFSEAGALQSIKRTEAEYLEESERWRFHYEIEFEHDRFDGYVDFEFSVLSSAIIGFNIKPTGTDD